MSFSKNINDVAKELKRRIEMPLKSQASKQIAEKDAVDWFIHSIGNIMGNSNNKGDVKKTIDDIFKSPEFSSYRGKTKTELLKIKRGALGQLEKKKLELTKQGRTESNLDFVLRQGNITTPFRIDPAFEKTKAGVAMEVEKGNRDRNATDSMGIVRLAKTHADIGGMYMYFYDAKTKEKLPYYDTFPLMLMIGASKGGFVGINLHYVPPELRVIIIEQILENARVETSDSVLYQMNYAFLNKIATTAWKPCFKRYLYSQIRTQMYEVPIESWDKAIYLPSNAFVTYQNGRNRTIGTARVWSDSLRKM